MRKGSEAENYLAIEKILIGLRVLFSLGRPILALLLALLFLFNVMPHYIPPGWTFEAPFLLLVLNTIFLSLVPLLIAIYALRSYLGGGPSQVLFLGCGMLTFGLTSFIAGWYGDQAQANINLTIHNTGLLMTSVFFLLGGIISYFGKSIPQLEGKRKHAPPVIVFPGIVFFIILLLLAALQGYTPAFYIRGSGPTIFREVALTAAAIFFGSSSLLVGISDRFRRSFFLGFYAMALAMIAIGIIALMTSVLPNSALSWLGRSAQYLAGVYFMAAAVAVVWAAWANRWTVPDTFADFFRHSEVLYREVVETATDAIMQIGGSGEIFLWNSAAEGMFGYDRIEFSRLTLSDLVGPEDLRNLFGDLEMLEKSGETRLIREVKARRKTGEEFPAEVSISSRVSMRGSIHILFVRDITDRRRAEEALAAANERASWLARLPEENPSPVMRVTAEGKILYCNPTAKGLSGWNCEAGELIPHPLLKVLGKAMESGIEAQEDLELGGRVYTVWIVPITGECYANVYGRDITERKQADEALRESERRFSTLYSSMTEGVAQHEVVHDSTGHPIDYIIWDVNPAFEAITGLSKDKVVGKKASEIYGTGEAPYLDFYSGVASSGQAKTFETYFPPMKKHFSISVFSPVKGRFATVFQDITERHRVEEDRQRLLAAIQAERDKLQILINSITDEVWFADTQKKFTLVNPSALREFNIPKEGNGIEVEKLAASLEVYRPDGSPRPVEEAPPMRALQGEVIKNQEEMVRTPGSGELRYRQVSSGPVRDGVGNIIGSVSVVRDITERKRAEEALRKVKEELEIRVQERTEELANSRERLQELATQLLLAQEKERKRVAVEVHDGLLSELAATKFLLEGKLSLLKKGILVDPSEFDRAVDILALSIKEARRIMNNLHPSVLDELGLIAAMTWSCGEYQKSYPHIKVETKIEVLEQDISESVKIVIFRVLQEALNNFARHGKGDRVELSISKADGALEFMIRDNGQGFYVETAQKGLGLESMRERVEISGGKFQIESTIGQGTTIRAIWNSP